MRVKAIIAYDGGDFLGFQQQKSTKNTVTTNIENALKNININSAIIGSGRTDAGVHASGQVISFDIPPYWSDLTRLKKELNRKLKRIYIKQISKVDNNFHARFNAKKRIYRYIFKQKLPSIFEENYISHYPSFDPEIVTKALKLFEGEHDFKYFQKSGSIVHTTTRKIYSTNFIKRGDYYYIYFQANGFLRAQVRIMIGAIMLCADNRLTLTQLQEQIDVTKKHITSLAPPEGLYLARVIYNKIG